jgi:hypothetical protein
VCPEIPESGDFAPCDPPIPELTSFQPIVTVEEIDSGIAFVTPLGTPSLVLAERTVGDEITPIVLTLAFGEDVNDSIAIGEVGVLAPPDEPLRARGTVSAHFCESDWHVSEAGLLHVPDVLGYRGVALLCGDSGCALYGIVESEGALVGLSLLPGGEVPLAETVGSYWLLASEEPQTCQAVCAYGDGLACFDGFSWTVIGDPGESLDRAADVIYGDSGEYRILLVTDSGGLHTISPTGDGWSLFGDPIAPLSVSWFDPHWGSMFVAGGDGVVALGGDGGEPLICPIPGASFPVVLGHKVPHYLMEGCHGFLAAALLTQAGEVLQIDQCDDAWEGPSRVCAMGEPPMGAPRALGRWLAPGKGSPHQFLITETGLYTRQFRWFGGY